MYRPRIYYLHPLLAGPIDTWEPHFDRGAALGFDTILMAPPFLPGRRGDLFLTANHDRLHPALGAGDALEAIAACARQARARGLDLMIDLVADRVAVEAPIARQYRASDLQQRDDPPDPRRGLDDWGATLLQLEGLNHGLLGWWQAMLRHWLQAGVAGFQCVAAARPPAGFWGQLISASREERPGARFIAQIHAAPADKVRDLAGCGFDLATSSSWAWDFRSDWLDADTRRAAALGGVLAMPELPFGERIGASEPARSRALHFAALFGQGWLMPMGFEFAAQEKLDPARGTPDQFARVAEAGGAAAASVMNANRDLGDAAAECAGVVVSPPDADVAAIWQRTADGAGRLLLANARLDRPATVPPEGYAASLPGGARASNMADLPPGAVRLEDLRFTTPVVSQSTDPGGALAARQPRIAVESIRPSVDRGQFAAKCRLGEPVEVAADLICDGHATLAARLLWKADDEAEWREAKLTMLANDRWSGIFTPLRLGRHSFTIEAWVDEFAGYRNELSKKHAAGLDLSLELQEGTALLAKAAGTTRDAALRNIVAELKGGSAEAAVAALLGEATAQAMSAADQRPHLFRLQPALPLDVERQAAGFASWFEIFPRSQSGSPDRHGTFDDVIARLPAIRDMGFDVLYFPPIHPIGRKNRKGRNNSLRAAPGDPGSPYAIGAGEGGHDAIHPELGTLDDFRRLIRAAAAHGIEIALDFAIQCSPDHPWLREHPEWFEWRPDGSVRYAENPPKKYEDIVNVAFYAPGAVPALWLALRDIVRFWVAQGVRQFRVDNPHTKPLPFWQWLIAEIRSDHPDAIFLAEAFTRPKMMYRLAKVGFSQSYTYFTWRNTALELREYLVELTTTAPRDFFRPHFFVNTPDINPLFLQTSGRPGFLLRAALAATLSGLWGVYNGFELCEARALEGREEYLDSEKYQIRAWDTDRPGNIIGEITRLNQIRRSNPALQSHLRVVFLRCSSEAVLCFIKHTTEFDNVVLVAVSLDPLSIQNFEVEIAPSAIGLAAHSGLRATDLMHGSAEDWQTGPRGFRLDPADMPFSIWRLRPLTTG